MVRSIFLDFEKQELFSEEVEATVALAVLCQNKALVLLLLLSWSILAEEVFQTFLDRRRLRGALLLRPKEVENRFDRQCTLVCARTLILKDFFINLN